MKLVFTTLFLSVGLLCSCHSDLTVEHECKEPNTKSSNRLEFIAEQEVSPYYHARIYRDKETGRELVFYRESVIILK